MSLLKRQLKTAFAHIGECERITNDISKDGESNYELTALKEKFLQMRGYLNQINPDIVQAQFRQNLNTGDLLDRHVNHAKDSLTARAIGVFAHLNDLNRHFSAEGDTKSVLNLEKIRRYARKTDNTLYLMLHRKIAFLLSWWSVLLILVVGLIVAFAFYVQLHATATSTLTPVQNLKTSVSIGTTQVQAAAASGSSPIDAAFKSVDTFLNVIGKVPKAIVAMTSSLTALQALILAVKKFKT